MAILIDETTRVICQGITSSQDTFCCGQTTIFGIRTVCGAATMKDGAQKIVAAVKG